MTEAATSHCTEHCAGSALCAKCLSRPTTIDVLFLGTNVVYVAGTKVRCPSCQRGTLDAQLFMDLIDDGRKRQIMQRAAQSTRVDRQAALVAAFLAPPIINSGGGCVTYSSTPCVSTGDGVTIVHTGGNGTTVVVDGRPVRASADELADELRDRVVRAKSVECNAVCRCHFEGGARLKCHGGILFCEFKGGSTGTCLGRMEGGRVLDGSSVTCSGIAESVFVGSSSRLVCARAVNCKCEDGGVILETETK